MEGLISRVRQHLSQFFFLGLEANRSLQEEWGKSWVVVE